jgi:hypothetical protein
MCPREERLEAHRFAGSKQVPAKGAGVYHNAAGSTLIRSIALAG